MIACERQSEFGDRRNGTQSAGTDAFSELYEQHVQAAHGLALRLTGSSTGRGRRSGGNVAGLARITQQFTF